MVEKIGTALEDKETVYNFAPYHYGEKFYVYTTNLVDMRYFEKLALADPENVKITKDDKYCMEFLLPMKYFRRPKMPRVLTDEQREQARLRMAEMRAAQLKDA